MWKLTIFGAILLHLVASSSGQAPPCDSAQCKLPDCRCSGEDIPGGLTRNSIPQMVFLSFDEAVTWNNFDLYQEILNNRTNPNGHQITATFFVTHDYTNYSMLHQLYTQGHEIALHSISGNPLQEYWTGLNQTGWSNEIMGLVTIMELFGRIPATEIKGMRAPQLRIGGDPMYSAISGLQYDCSRPTQVYRKTLWPYTNDYKSTQDCEIHPCPTGQYKGFWTVPMPNWEANWARKAATCSMADQCTINGCLPRTEAETYNLMLNNFNEHYNGNRTPFGIFIRHAWIHGFDNPGDNQIAQRRLGYTKFLNYLGTLPDVYLVSISRGIEWIKTPKNLDESKDFDAFKVTEKTNQCGVTYNCHYANPPFPIVGQRYLRSCIPCPRNYPWIGNPSGA